MTTKVTTICDFCGITFDNKKQQKIKSETFSWDICDQCVPQNITQKIKELTPD